MTSTILDGRHPWGALQIDPIDRTASAICYRLAVFPPGITVAQRRALVFRRHWGASGALLAVVVAAVLGEVLNGWAALVLGAAVCAAGWVVSAAVAGDARRRVLKVRATVMRGFGQPEVLGDLAGLEHAAGRLLGLDALSGADAPTPVEYEFLWNRIYLELSDHLALAAR